VVDVSSVRLCGMSAIKQTKIIKIEVTAAECQTLAGVLLPSCALPVADG